jgi:hypothetical protein
MVDAVQGRDTSVRDTISKGGFVQGAQHPRIFGRGHIGRRHINPASNRMFAGKPGPLEINQLCVCLNVPWNCSEQSEPLPGSSSRCNQIEFRTFFSFKGSLTRDFQLQVFYMNQCSNVYHWCRRHRR